MHHRRWGLTLLVLGTVGIAAVAVWTLQRQPAPAPNPPGTFAFAALGDAPYDTWEAYRFQHVLEEMNAHDLSWVLHVGDIFDRPCTDDHYRAALGRFNSLRHPVIYSPGDNEWADCWLPGAGSFAPRERFASLRRIFFADPRQSLGGRRLPLQTQADRPVFHEFVEHARWSHAGMIFATVHLIGSGNGLRSFPARTSTDDAEVQRRTVAAAAWLRDTFAEATAVKAPAVVVAFHAPPGFGQPIERRRAYEPFAVALEEEVERFGKPVLAVHGDLHDFIVDHPLVRRTTGQWLANFTRLEVPGSPDVGWVRVIVSPAAAQPFTFEPRVVSGWRFW